LPLPVEMSASQTVTALNLRAQIHDLVTELREAQVEMHSGPTVLMIVNELCLVCEDVFNFDDTVHGRDVMKGLANHAEEIRATNGELSEEFFTFLDTEFRRGESLAA
jgi:hypothetical protein